MSRCFVQGRRQFLLSPALAGDLGIGAEVIEMPYELETVHEHCVPCSVATELLNQFNSPAPLDPEQLFADRTVYDGHI